MNKKIIAIILSGLMAFSVTGCRRIESGGVAETSEMQRELMSESQRQIGMPEITNFFEKQMAKDIFELRDQVDLTTHAYFQNMEGQFVYLGRCIGYGLPYTTQYSNPMSMEWLTYPKLTKDVLSTYDYNYTSELVPQADPNGLYSSGTTDATWLMLVNEDTNETEIIYAEPGIVVTQSKLPKRLVADWSLPNNY